MKHFVLCALFLPALLLSQAPIIIDGRFEEWRAIPVAATDPANDEHDTDWYGDNLAQPLPRTYGDVDILEVKFTHDSQNLYGYVKARGQIGRTSKASDGHKAGRYYFIITIDVDDSDSTGYPLQQGGYWPNSTGYDVNMEVEFYDGAFNTGHYILHSFLSPAALIQGRTDLSQHIVRLAPGNYDDYLQWVVFPDSSFVYVEDRGPALENGIIKVAVSGDGHEAEMMAPMWGFFNKPNGQPLVQLGQKLDISFSLEGSGELSEGALAMGYAGKKSLWASDTAPPIVGYHLSTPATAVAGHAHQPDLFELSPNYPNPFNGSTTLSYNLPRSGHVSILVHDSRGRQVVELVHGLQQAGAHQLTWQGVNEKGASCPSGLYFVQLQWQGQRSVRRVLLLR